MEDLAWYCLRTQTKRENLAAAALREMGGIEVLSPRLRYKKATRRGKVWWVEALFPGYILARFSLSEQERAVSYAKGVSRILRFGGSAPTVPASPGGGTEGGTGTAGRRRRHPRSVSHRWLRATRSS